jgi:hypothetical protein
MIVSSSPQYSDSKYFRVAPKMTQTEHHPQLFPRTPDTLYPAERHASKM